MKIRLSLCVVDRLALVFVTAVAWLLVTLAGAGALSAPGQLVKASAPPDMQALGRYHFEYGTTQGWFAQPEGSLPTADVVVTATTAAAWSGSYSMRVGVSGDAGGWSAAAGLDDPAAAMSPTGTLTAHLYVPVTSTVAWAHFYVLDRDWAWSSGPTVTLQPGSWITLTWDISTAVARPIHRLGVQFGGDAAGSGEATASLDDALYLDAIDWSHPAYSHTLCAGAYLSGTWTARFPDELAWLDGAGGKHAGLINVFVGWTAPFPADVVNAVLDHQGTPMITWEPWVDLAQITAGAYDAYLDEWADAIAQTQSPVFMRWGHEMNGCISGDDPPCWYPWGGDPEAYRAAWRYVHDRIEVVNGVENAVWAWTPNATQGNLYADYGDYYPGDGYVDWVGASGFNAARKAAWDPKPPCLTFDDLFSPILYDMAARYPKPQVVAEFASACDNGCDKALWIAEAYHQALFHPRLRALVWFNVAKWEGQGAQRKWVDWRVDCGGGCPDCTAAYARALAHPRYLCVACRAYLPLAPRSP